jgi:acyl dehydratase
MNTPCPTAISTVLPTRRFGPITRTDIVRYQGASGDLNPVHHDDEYAHRHGYAGAFSLGMLCAGYLATYVCAIYGPQSVRFFKTRFVKITWPGDTVDCSGTIVRSAVDPNGQGILCELELVCSGSRGEQVVAGTARVKVVRDSAA